MKAAVLVELNRPLEVVDLEVPQLEVGQVLVRVACSGICGAQLGEIAGVKGPDKYLPHLMGHEAGGVVEAIGPGVMHLQPGDAVVLHWRKGVGIQARPAIYRWGNRTVNAGWVTTFQELTVVSENRATPIPKDVPFEIAALLGCAVTTAFGLLNNDAQLKIGQSLAVIGCGGVGLSVVQGAALIAAHPIIAIDVHDSKLAMAREFGATHTIHSGREDLRTALRAIVGNAGVDVIVENTGKVRLIEAAYELTAAQGRTILVGVPRHDEKITIHSLPLHFDKVLTGCEGGHTDPRADIPRYLRLYQSGKLPLQKLITHRLPLERINEALDTVRGGEAGRVIVEMPSA